MQRRTHAQSADTSDAFRERPPHSRQLRGRHDRPATADAFRREQPRPPDHHQLQSGIGEGREDLRRARGALGGGNQIIQREHLAAVAGRARKPDAH